MKLNIEKQMRYYYLFTEKQTNSISRDGLFINEHILYW